MYGTLKLIGSQRQIERQIVRAASDQFARQLNGRILRRKGTLLKTIRDEVKRRITSCPEWVSMQSGVLKSELGIDSTSRLDGILSIWLESIQLSFNGFKATPDGKLTGSLRIYGIDASYDDVINSPAAQIEIKKGIWNFISMLLYAGDQIVVRDYRILSNKDSLQKWSRSKTSTIMIRSEQSSWAVPSEFSGTQQNNFVTRSLVGINDFIEQQIRHILA